MNTEWPRIRSSCARAVSAHTETAAATPASAWICSVGTVHALSAATFSARWMRTLCPIGQSRDLRKSGLHQPFKNNHEQRRRLLPSSSYKDATDLYKVKLCTIIAANRTVFELKVYRSYHRLYSIYNDPMKGMILWLFCTFGLL